VHRIWQKYGLQPHRVETFKFSRLQDERWLLEAIRLSRSPALLPVFVLSLYSPAGQ
jgi:hypothetical protein